MGSPQRGAGPGTRTSPLLPLSSPLGRDKAKLNVGHGVTCGAIRIRMSPGPAAPRDSHVVWRWGAGTPGQGLLNAPVGRVQEKVSFAV